MMSVLWKRIQHAVETGDERAKADLKQTMDLSDRPGRAHFAKDVLAMANTRGGPGYIIVGVLDKKDRTSNDPADYVMGFSSPDRDAFERLMVQALDFFCAKPIPSIRYEEVLHPQVQKNIGVVVVERAYHRPYTPARDGDKLHTGKVYVRRSAETFTASDDEIRAMKEVAAAKYRVLINFGRRITNSQVQQIERLTEARVDEIISADYLLDDTQPYEAQLLNLVQSVGITKYEWESLPLVVNIHPFAPAAAGVLAQIHGLRGNFPGILRLRQNDAGEFEVVEILNLQRLRNEIRHWGDRL
jgi:predicted HTH transcriptional regulator